MTGPDVLIAVGTLGAGYVAGRIAMTVVARRCTGLPDPILTAAIVLGLDKSQPVSDRWSAQLESLLDQHEPRWNHPGYSISLCNINVWVENWPYAYGQCVESNGSPSGNPIPVAATRVRLRRAVERMIEEQP